MLFSVSSRMYALPSVKPVCGQGGGTDTHDNVCKPVFVERRVDAALASAQQASLPPHLQVYVDLVFKHCSGQMVTVRVHALQQAAPNGPVCTRTTHAHTHAHHEPSSQQVCISSHTGQSMSPYVCDGPATEPSVHKCACVCMCVDNQPVDENSLDKVGTTRLLKSSLGSVLPICSNGPTAEGGAPAAHKQVNKGASCPYTKVTCMWDIL